MVQDTAKDKHDKVRHYFNFSEEAKHQKQFQWKKVTLTEISTTHTPTQL